jgi:DNA-binding beta-propeller fold protein YncE
VGRFSGQSRTAFLALLAALSLSLSACTITLFEDGSSGDHSHEPGTGEHDHGDDAAVDIDHHGNPIFDEEERVYEQVTAGGVSVEFTVENYIGVGGRGGELAPRLVEGEHANLQFHITDLETAEPVAGLNPAVWVDPALGDVGCSTRVQGYLSGTIESRPAIDLNSYFILGMNRDNTISVIDPMINVGGMTNLFSVILLQAAPQDWTMAPERSRLFATMPSMNGVAVVDLNAFLVEDMVDVDGQPGQIVLEPGGTRAWVTLGRNGCVATIDTETLGVETIRTEGAVGAIAFSARGDRALVGTVDALLVFDTDTLREVNRSTLAGTPGAIAVSTGTGDAYVTQPATGIISIVNSASGAENALLRVDAGVSQIGMSPDGRWGLAVNPRLEKAYIIETANRRITHEIPVNGSPDQVTFTDEAAYIHNGGSPSVTVIPLDEIDATGDISVLTVPIGDRPPGTSGEPTGAEAITITPDGNSLLIANPADDTVYFYTEGSQAALGGFQGHTLEPRAVRVVDRSLKEPSPGVYTGSIRIPQSGQFVVAFLLDEPRLIHCFTFTAKTADEPLQGIEANAEIRVLSDEPPRAGELHDFRFELLGGDTGTPLSSNEDVIARIIQTGGNWNTSLKATPSADGTYSLSFTPPSKGVYSVLLAVPSLGIDLGTLPQISIEVVSE